MRLAGKVAVVTGGGRGIGRALCLRFAAEGAAGVVVADIDAAAAAAVADEVEGLAVVADAAEESAVVRVLDAAERRYGRPPDLFCANAGAGADGGISASDAVWERSWRVNVLSHVYAARHAIPRMLAGGGGHLLHTASAAGLLSMPGAAPYTVAKHATVALAEWLAITYGDRGITVSCLCPQAVDTRLLREQTEPAIAEAMTAVSAVLDPADVAQAVVDGLADGRFLILSHPEVADHARRKAEDPDRWLAGMRRMARRFGL